MKTITWQFSTPKEQNEISKLIRLKTCSEISHVDVLTTDGKYLIGAHIADGMLARKVDYEEFGLRIQVTVDVTDQQCRLFWEYINSIIGQQYNCAGILAEATGFELTQQGHTFCSEAQADGIKHCGRFKLMKDSCLIDPETLRMVVSSDYSSVERRIVG